MASGPNKGFYYISDSNYWEEWISFNWWITPGFRTSEGKFWITTKQIEGYMEKEVMSYIQGLIGHETDGTSTNSLGHRKIIISKIQGNPNYDPKSSIEEIISYNDIKALKNKYKQKIQATNNKFKKYYMNGENHPKWGNGHAKLWVTNPKGNKWGYMEPYW